MCGKTLVPCPSLSAGCQAVEHQLAAISSLVYLCSPAPSSSCLVEVAARLGVDPPVAETRARVLQPSLVKPICQFPDLLPHGVLVILSASSPRTLPHLLLISSSPPYSPPRFHRSIPML